VEIDAVRLWKFGIGRAELATTAVVFTGDVTLSTWRQDDCPGEQEKGGVEENTEDAHDFLWAGVGASVETTIGLQRDFVRGMSIEPPLLDEEEEELAAMVE
jgi:hypothetical protein